MTSHPPELPLDLAHLDDLRERIVQADEAIVSFVCLRVQLAREELAYRRERGLPEWDGVFEQRERIRLEQALQLHQDGVEAQWARLFAAHLTWYVRQIISPVDDGRYDPATGDIGF